MRVTRNQVAQLAKVSSATVSRVFNSPSSVSENLRDSVYLAAKELGYKPNKNAAQLRRSSTGVISVVEIDKSNRSYYWGSLSMFDWFYGQAMRGLHNAIENTSYQLNFSRISSREELEKIANNCDGIIGYDIDDDREESLFSDLQVPCLLAHHILPSNKYHHVSTNNREGGIIQGNYLKSLGCEKPLYITGYLDKVIAHSQRLEGLKSVYPDIDVVEVPFIEKDKIEELILMIKDSFDKNKYDSLAAINDYTLTKVLLKISGDFPAIGYDSAPFTKFLNRSVASIDLDIEGIYYKALTNLIGYLNGGPLESETISPKLVI
ncbi:MAG: LacI family DNA-binding transcriptional regulator [Spirochaetaceae bacterium]|nr:LacI family DNA-binding transcriptional regulator [Spirochaetaceae bacterium]